MSRHRTRGKVAVPPAIGAAHLAPWLIDAILSAMGRGGQLLSPGVPRPCHVCGAGTYEPELLQQDNPVLGLRFWHTPHGANTSNLMVRVYTCSSCGHTAVFK